MRQEDIFAAAIGVRPPWTITKVNLEIGDGELHIEIDFPSGSEFEYLDDSTGRTSLHKAYDTSVKTWRHMNFFQYRCYLHARIPRVRTEGGKIKQVTAPWEGAVGGFTMLFEAFILQLVKAMPVHQVSAMVGSYDAKIWKILKTYTERGREKSDHGKVAKVGVDETAARRGHDYVSLFVDLEQKKTLFVAEGKGSETVAEFAKDLEEHQGNAQNVTNISCDMSPAFIKGVEENLPNADITFDRFHVVKIINDAVDKVRRVEAKTNPLLKNSRYVFLKNRENLTPKQREKYEQIKMSKLNIKTFKAMQIRESFQQIYAAQKKADFEGLLKKWYWWATHSRIPQVIEAARTIKRHWAGIVNWAENRITNGILEGFNSLFQAAKAKARGYRKTETIKAVIYILTGKLDFARVNPFCATHTLL